MKFSICNANGIMMRGKIISLNKNLDGTYTLIGYITHYGKEVINGHLDEFTLNSLSDITVSW